MKSILDWLQHNKEWFFSGAGVTVVLAVIALFRWFSRLATSAPPALDSGLRISLAFGGLTYDGPPYLSDQMLIFTVANSSHRPVQLTSIRLPLKDGANMVFPHLDGDNRLPCIVAPGSSNKFLGEAR